MTDFGISHPVTDVGPKRCDVCSTILQLDWNFCPQCGMEVDPDVPTSFQG